jgi:hypothetical protein
MVDGQMVVSTLLTTVMVRHISGVMVDGLPVEIPLDVQLVLLLLPGICMCGI